MHLEIITYANKSQGRFEELVNNEFNINVTVLGWGTEWKGFSDKYKAMSEYLEHKNDEDIVVFLDGFDTKINKDPVNLVNIFADMDCKVLVSRDPVPVAWVSREIFGTCKNNVVANSGLYMGYVKYVKQFINDALNMKCDDDQVNLNTLCHKYDFIKVDEDERVFKNISPLDSETMSDSIFVSFPGTISINRIKRSIIDLTQFTYLYICFILITLIAIFPKYSTELLMCLITFIIFYGTVVDRSCTY